MVSAFFCALYTTPIVKNQKKGGILLGTIVCMIMVAIISLELIKILR